MQTKSAKWNCKKKIRNYFVQSFCASEAALNKDVETVMHLMRLSWTHVSAADRNEIPFRREILFNIYLIKNLTSFTRKCDTYNHNSLPCYWGSFDWKWRKKFIAEEIAFVILKIVQLHCAQCTLFAWRWKQASNNSQSFVFMCVRRTRSLIYSYFNDDKYASAPHLSCDNCVWRNSWTPKELQSILLICMRFFIAWAVRVSLPIESFQLATINSMKSLFPMCKKWAPHACKRYFSIP